jgi:hypothetical protein
MLIILSTFAKLTARRFFLLAPAVVSLIAGSTQAREFAAVALGLAVVAFVAEAVIRSFR